MEGQGVKYVVRWQQLDLIQVATEMYGHRVG